PDGALTGAAARADTVLAGRFRAAFCAHSKGAALIDSAARERRSNMQGLQLVSTGPTAVASSHGGRHQFNSRKSMGAPADWPAAISDAGDVLRSTPRTKEPPQAPAWPAGRKRRRV